MALILHDVFVSGPLCTGGSLIRRRLKLIKPCGACYCALHLGGCPKPGLQVAVVLVIVIIIRVITVIAIMEAVTKITMVIMMTITINILMLIIVRKALLGLTAE